MAFWTNESVLALAGTEDPERVVAEHAQQIALEAMSEGWRGPPYDPFELADRLNVSVVAREDLYDARTVAEPDGRLTVEFNPNRPRGRVRYSVAHELAHTFFPDVASQVRYRSSPEGVQGDAWQLEMLCNIAAAELLMPAGTFPELTSEALDIESLMALRRKYDVSTEALLLRIAKLTEQPATMFAASRLDPDKLDAPLHVDYWRGTRAWTAKLRHGGRLPKESVVYECTAVGFTARGEERWVDAGDVHVEAVGVPPYPGKRLPRVVGLMRPRESVIAPARRRIEYLTGDATKPRGAGRRIIAHVVNDRTANWGGEFARALRDEYPAAQDAFRRWAAEHAGNLRLGSVHIVEVDTELEVATMVAQRGYGPSSASRLRYDALRTALDVVSEHAHARAATVHMPRIGAGMAGGDWNVIEELIDAELVASDIEVVVYQWPRAAPRRFDSEQQALTVVE